MATAYHRKSWAWLFAAALPVLFAVDALMGLVYRTNTNAAVQVIPPRSGKTRRAIVIFPGYIMPGTLLSRAFAPYVADDDALVVVNYAERGVNVSQIQDKVMEALPALKPVELLVYGASKIGR